MRAQRTELTQAAIDRLTTDKPDEWVYGTKHGLCIRLRRGADGVVSKTAYVAYELDGKPGKIPLGAVSDYERIEDMELEAYGIRKDARNGDDPKAVRAKAHKPRPDFKSLAIEYIEWRAGTPHGTTLRRNTKRGDVRYLLGENRDYFNSLHKDKIDAISKRQIVECLDAIAKTSTSAAKQAREALCGLYDYAGLKGYVPEGHNPARYTEQFARDDELKGRAHSDAELIAIWNAAEACKNAEARSDRDYGRIMQLVALLGNRREEIGGMPWEEIKDNIWHLPAEGSKTKIARRIPLSPMALAIIGERPPGRMYVFGDHDKGFSNWSKCAEKFGERLAGKLDGPWKPHDLRRTMRTGLDRLGVDERLAELTLGHIEKKLIRDYQRNDQLDQRATAMGKWQAYVEGLVNGVITRRQFAA